MSVRFYLNEVASRDVKRVRVPESKTTSAHTRYELGDESVREANGHYYFDDFRDLLMVDASPEFLKRIGQVTATYYAPRHTSSASMRESGQYYLGQASAIVEPYMAGGNKGTYETYTVTLSGPALDGVKKLLLAILEGSIRPQRIIHGKQQGLPSAFTEKVVADQKRTIIELYEQLVRAQMVIDSFNAVYADYQRLVKEQQTVIDMHRK